jgi:hypothetical protein
LISPLGMVCFSNSVLYLFRCFYFLHQSYTLKRACKK